GHEPVQPRPSVCIQRQQFMNLGLGPSRHRPIVAGRDERYGGKGMPMLLLCGNHERTCVVALPSLDGDAFACGTDFHLVITGGAVVAMRHVCQGVLVASLLSYSRIELFHGGTLDG